MVYIVMGVSGAGKTTIGKLLAEKIGLPFYDGDDFHPQENISNMEKGIPLTDEDREGWLQALAEQIAKWEKSGGAVLACSALKEKYRRALSAKEPNTEWIFLDGSRQLINERLLDRHGHFMDAGLLDSQFQILEEPTYGISVSIEDEPSVVVQEIVEKIRLA